MPYWPIYFRTQYEATHYIGAKSPALVVEQVKKNTVPTMKQNCTAEPSLETIQVSAEN